MNKNLFYLFLLLNCLSSEIAGQNKFGISYFPLEVGNRWDYLTTLFVHGGDFYIDTAIVEIVSDTVINNHTYFVFSRSLYYDFNNDWKYLRIQNDSLFCFNTLNSTDCLIFAFNQSIGEYYQCCRYDSVIFFEETFYPNFGEDDTQQRHANYNTSFDCSQQFGIVGIDEVLSLQELQYQLLGCIISGNIYGELLTQIHKSENEIKTFSLKQNYPNPFNPTTKIKYSIPRFSLVQIKVFDILGMEIETIINEGKPAGSYEMTWNAANLSSGVYFYQMRIGDCIQTKKMILLK